MAPPLLPNGIQEPAEPYVQPEEEVIEQDNDDVGNKSEHADHDQFNNQIIRQNEQRANSLEDLNLENLFREQKHLIIHQSLNKHLQLVLFSTKL